MPRISFFYGIAIYMYWDEGHHGVPHFHAYLGDRDAVFALDGTALEGSLPPRARRLVTEWARARRAELAANWERARNGQSLEPVPPLT